MWKRFVNDYLSYSYKERIGILTLVALIVLCTFAPLTYPYFFRQKQYDHRNFDSEIARLKFRDPDSSVFVKSADNGDNNVADDLQPDRRSVYAKSNAELFSFDPNNTSAADWKRLGVKDKTVQTIQKYLAKGGHFYKPPDLSKIWGLHPEDISRLTPYITITQKETVLKSYNAAPPAYSKQTAYSHKNIAPLDINTADTTAFIALPGIGSKLAQRIVKFREKLGGYYMVDQVAETFGLPDSTFQKIKAYLVSSSVPVKKFDLNAARLDDMKSHPYIRYAIANAIVQYRTLHGNFSSVSDLKKIMMVTDEIYRKMEPYVTVSQ